MFLKQLKNIIILKTKVYKNISVKEIEMAKQVKIEDIMMPIFDGANYSSWRIRLMTLLEYKECKGQNNDCCRKNQRSRVEENGFKRENHNNEYNIR